MQSDKTLRRVTWAYFAVLLGMTIGGAWMAYPVIQEQRAQRAAALTVDIQALPFISIFKDAAIGGYTSASIDRFLAPEVFADALVEIMGNHAPPLTKETNRQTWAQELAAEMATGVNRYLARRYRDSFERLEVTSEAKGLVLVRIENRGAAPVEEMRVEVAGAQLFMDLAANKLRSLGSRATRINTMAPGEKIVLLAPTTEDLGAGSPKVQVMVKNQPVPVTLHDPNAPFPAAKMAGWIAFGTVYVALILAGLGIKSLSLFGLRFRAVSPVASSPAAPVSAAVVTPLPSGVPLTPAQQSAWRRPGAA